MQKTDERKKREPGVKGEQGIQGTSYPISVATDGANHATLSASNITVNYKKISGDVAAGAPVSVKFNWVYNATASGCTDCFVQIYVGFDGLPWTCLNSSVGNESGVYNGTLIAPTTPGPHRITIQRMWNYSCGRLMSANMSINPAHGSTVGVVAVR